MNRERTYTVLCPFGGLGAGALGFTRATAALRGVNAGFQLLGGIDIDGEACADFEYLTGAPELCADIHELTATRLVDVFGPRAPDVVFLSPPCKGSSALLSAKNARKAKYRKLNRLALAWIKVMLEAWADAPPRLVLFENVPRITERAARMLSAARGHLKRAGYAIHEGRHDCGELGGLAQHRERYLMIARHKASTPHFVYKPAIRRVRACGDVLGPLPLPNDSIAGPMHRLPGICWLNWVRLAMIPAGGDHRDIEGVLAEGQARRELWKRHAVQDWGQATGVVGGSGSNGVGNIADPRVENAFNGSLGVTYWEEPSGVVTGGGSPSRWRFAVADPRIDLGRCQAFMTCRRHADRVDRDPRLGRPIPVCEPCFRARMALVQPGNPNMHDGKFDVRGFDEPAGAITGASRPGSGAQSVADPRLHLGPNAHTNVLRVSSWDDPAGTVTGAARPSSGAPSVADPRPFGHVNRVSSSNVLRIVPWNEPTPTVTAGAGPTNGGGAVADPRLTCDVWPDTYGVIGWDEASGAVMAHGKIDNGRAAVADPRVGESPAWNRGQGYGVMTWDAPSDTVAAGSHLGQGKYAVADPRDAAALLERLQIVGFVPLDDAMATVTGLIATPFALVDPSSDGAPRMVVHNAKKAPPFAPVIVAADGTWHRPLTVLEKAVLQGLPHWHNGAPLKLAGDSVSRWQERIGNAVPVQTAEAIAEQMLLCLIASDLGTFALSSGGSIWVAPEASVLQ